MVIGKYHLNIGITSVDNSNSTQTTAIVSPVVFKVSTKSPKIRAGVRIKKAKSSAKKK